MKHAIYRIALFVLLMTSHSVTAAISEGDEREASEKAFEVADKMLNDVYAKLLNLVDKEQQGMLRLEQQAWIKKRDAQADRIAQPMKQTNMYNMMRNDALRVATVNRFAELLNLYFDRYAIALDRSAVQEE